jgi:ribosomal-protein-alanine N-acetyltransferase
MTGHRLLPGADPRLRIAPWRGDPTTAHLTPARGRPTADAVRRALAELDEGPFRAALTPALADTEQQPFLDAGFEVHQRLLLLIRGLDDLPSAPAISAELRRGRHRDRPAILAVDQAAFPPFWQLDAAGLADALTATPSARLRVAAEGDGVCGYAVTGRAGTRGYLQRLAVDPPAQGRGIGTALVADGLRWLRRWGAKEVLVNTQESNRAAVELYERVGFELQPTGLAVLHRRVGEPPL